MSQNMIAAAKLFLVADKSELVAEGDPRAAFLYATPGDEIPAEAAEMFGLVDGDIDPALAERLAADREEAAAAEAAAAEAAEKEKAAAEAAAAEAAEKEKAAAADKAKPASANKAATK